MSRDHEEKRQGETAEAMFGKLATPLVDEAMEQASALNGDVDPEVLHKLRVALRRLRTLYWAYRPLLDEQFDEQQRAVFKFLATSAGSTRDWDILLELLNKLDVKQLAEPLQQRRDSALATSIQTITNADVKHVLHDSLREAKHQLNTGSERVPVEKFAQRRIHAAEKQLKKRIKRAQDAKQSDYAAYHEVRKAGKKVRYLLEFFEPAVGSGKGSHLKKLRRLQKRFGKLNDVVASRDLLSNEQGTLPEGSDSKRALRALRAEQKMRFKAARKAMH
jgi:CHAD domain-containing protein